VVQEQRSHFFIPVHLKINLCGAATKYCIDLALPGGQVAVPRSSSSRGRSSPALPPSTTRKCHSLPCSACFALQMTDAFPAQSLWMCFVLHFYLVPSTFRGVMPPSPCLCLPSSFIRTRLFTCPLPLRRSSGAKTVAATGASAKDTNYFKNKKPWDL
jgi:hypothetical protein